MIFIKFGSISLNNIISEFTDNPKNISGLLYQLQDQDIIVGIGNNLFLEKHKFKNILKIIKNFFISNREMEVADFKKLLGLSRKNAIPILEYLDKKQFTERNENIRRKGSQLDEK